jgi:hypothetical protein
MAALLSLAENLGDMMRTDLTVVGGLVPSLIIPQSELNDIETHCGTMDVDLGLSLALLHQRRHTGVSSRLRQAGFRPATDEDGLPVAYRWRPPPGVSQLPVDFLIAPTQDPTATGDVAQLGRDLAAVRTPGLQLALRDSLLVPISGASLEEAEVSSEVRVCGPGAFTVLKARAFRNRGEPKDAYDLTYVLSYFEDGPGAIGRSIRGLLDDGITQKTLAWLEEDFSELDSAGPLSVARFRVGQPDDEIQADAQGVVRELLRLVRK